MSVRLQPLARARVASLGDAGAAWLEGLPAVLAELAAAWQLTLGRPIAGGSASYVVGARTARQDDVVLKVAIRGDGLAEQVEVLQRAGGRGYVRLLAVDLSRHALLLERLGPSLDQSRRTPEDQLARLADTLALAWQDPLGRPPLAKAAGLAQLISEAWPRLGHPCSERVVAQALAYAEDLREIDEGELVVVHGDPHPGNALAASRPRGEAEAGYCFVDPDGFVAERAYDLGVALRDWSRRLSGDDARAVAEGYCRLLADRSGVSQERIWKWGFLERVSTGLYVMSFGATALGQTFLVTAERLV